MKTKLQHITTTLLLTVFSLSINGQDKIPTIDLVVFVDGTSKQGWLKVNNSNGIEFNNTIKLCLKNNKKKCTAYSVKDITSVIQAPPELIVKQLKELNGENPSKALQKLKDKSTMPDEFNIKTYINNYKVLHTNNKKGHVLAKLRYAGKNADFYYYAKPGKNGGQTLLTQPNTKTIVFNYNSTATSTKFSVSQLADYFKDCNTFTNIANQKKVYKKNNMLYFYKLTDACSN
ncbi:hypothetical protein OAE07_02405 [Winogradskyella sp.]|nr:hypothetical protein [Winogradskyella sp.]MDC0006806.1 hypothetical protein [Winogradskyella sp.]MDC1505297.1 hypothetical protein [Winogradskyella sp.]